MGPYSGFGHIRLTHARFRSCQRLLAVLSLSACWLACTVLGTNRDTGLVLSSITTMATDMKVKSKGLAFIAFGAQSTGWLVVMGQGGQLSV